MKKIRSKKAQCLCGGIKITIKGKLRDVFNCHCSQCTKTHGNYGSYTSCKLENLSFINKKTLKVIEKISLRKTNHIIYNVSNPNYIFSKTEILKKLKLNRLLKNY